MVTSASLPNQIVGAREQTSADGRPLKVMHVITDLDVGGAERMLVSYLTRSEEHTSELQSHLNIVCRLLLEKKKKTI